MESRNPYYSSYLLEMFCNFKWEYTSQYCQLWLNNWLVNLHEEPRHFIEHDLIQEHYNFWLEDLAQHKGIKFDDHFYWNVLFMHIHHFLYLKEEMEEHVLLKAWGKKYSKPHLNNELRTMMNILRENEAMLKVPGHNFDFKAIDNLQAGIKILWERKINEFITRITKHINILGQSARSELDPAAQSDIADEEDRNDEGIASDFTELGLLNEKIFILQHNHIELPLVGFSFIDRMICLPEP